MDLPELCMHLRAKIRSRISAVEILNFFNCTISGMILSDRNRCDLYLQLLNAAAKHNHTELLDCLLSDPLCVKNRSLKVVANPLFKLISSGNLESVELFLRANLTVNLVERFCTDMTRDDNINKDCLRNRFHYLSAIEYACILRKREILKILVLNDKERNHARIYNKVSERFDCSFNPSAGFCTPLHVIFELLKNSSFSFHVLSTLSATVQVVVEAGACVNDSARSEGLTNGVTPLIRLVYDMAMTHMKSTQFMSSGDRQMIFETVQILLKAGARTHEPIDYNPLDVLLRLVQHMCDNRDMSRYLSGLNSIYVFPDRDILLLIAGLTELIFKHGGRLSRSVFTNFLGPSGHIDIFCSAAFLVKKYDKIKHLSGSFVWYTNVMNCLLDLFRYYVYTETGADFTQIFNNAYLRRTNFVRDLVDLVNKSSVSGHSLKLVKLMLTTLKAADVQHLVRTLSFWIEFGPLDALSPTAEERREIKSYANALEFVRQVEIPFRLQHLARRVIVRTLSYKCLDDMSELGIPVQLHSYLLLREN